LSAGRTTIGVKEKLALVPEIKPAGTMGTLKFKSSKTSVATVSADGVVTAKRTGKVNITVSTYNGLSAVLKISIVKAPSSVKIVSDRDSLGVGETLKLGYKLSSGS